MEHGAGRRGIIWSMGQRGVASYGAWGREAWHHMGQGGVASYGAGRHGIIWSMGQGGVASYGTWGREAQQCFSSLSSKLRSLELYPRLNSEDQC